MNTIQLLNSTEIKSIKKLLQSNGLPHSDLETAPLHFFGVKENNEIIATGALEIYGKYAVLRSVAIKLHFQNLGYGKQIVKFLEKKAGELGVQKLYLLTTTAESFFRKLKYHPVQRELCPDKIKSSTQFNNICPSTASCLFKNLGV